MRMELLDRLEQATEFAASWIAQVSEADWPADTPCTEWSVRQLANHLIGGTLLLSQVASGQRVEPMALAPSTTANTEYRGLSAVDSYRTATKHALSALGSPGALRRRWAMPLGPLPGSVLGNLLIFDAVVHGWDLSRALGRPAVLSDELVSHVDWFARGFVQASARGRIFGAPVAVAEGASSCDRLMGFLGRAV
ncbi:TIGR03086 family protein [Pseudonocardiaceae bacterium YIM PH 21723]|nr:TIGR03086 family protein [Pseudonocardiaceae bacterium YIM PH 21723]